ncbi:hypothetical protein B0I37DRAFT_382511 [Chaetomium sp. MPI-CAGE-AT-0009]|nr:hypothetical protein B0I37DRAFT_382511 [Chaetomium sp. MPI-CAGE-AT-0009]
MSEAAVSGRPTPGLDRKLILGLAPITTEQAKDAFWAPNRKFGRIFARRTRRRPDGTARAIVRVGLCP